jgi:hypothetical protein
MPTIGKGSRVMLINHDGYMPPLGSRGVVVSDVDDAGDCDVLFHGHPCPAPPDITWCAHHSWLLPLDGGEPIRDAAEIGKSL